MTVVGLRTQVGGAARATVDEIDGRPVVQVEVHGDDRRGALSELRART